MMKRDLILRQLKPVPGALTDTKGKPLGPRDLAVAVQEVVCIRVQQELARPSNQNETQNPDSSLRQC